MYRLLLCEPILLLIITYNIKIFIKYLKNCYLIKCNYINQLFIENR